MYFQHTYTHFLSQLVFRRVSPTYTLGPCLSNRFSQYTQPHQHIFFIILSSKSYSQRRVISEPHPTRSFLMIKKMITLLRARGIPYMRENPNFKFSSEEGVTWKFQLAIIIIIPVLQKYSTTNISSLMMTSKQGRDRDRDKKSKSICTLNTQNVME
jgi:hypothetical protein